MNDTIATVEAPVEALPIPWTLWFAAIVSVVLAYLLVSENGALLAENWVYLHELAHDGRHVLGVPCH